MSISSNQFKSVQISSNQFKSVQISSNQFKSVQISSNQFKSVQIVNATSALNFDFVCGLRDLEWFKTNQSLPPELIPKLSGLPVLIKIEFASGKYKLERTSTGTFWLHGESLNWNLGLLAGNL